MVRKNSINRKAIPNNIRVKMYRQRQKLKKMREQTVNNQENSLNSVNVIENEPEAQTLRTQLRDWAIMFRISKRALNGLLGILNSCGMSVPKNYRTLLETPLNVEINDVAGGRFWYNGLEKCLKSIFSTVDRDITISLNIRIDGLPLYNSSKIFFWPILASIHGVYMMPFNERYFLTEMFI